jgi:hypothetical protein
MKGNVEGGCAAMGCAFMILFFLIGMTIASNANEILELIKLWIESK